MAGRRGRVQQADSLGAGVILAYTVVLTVLVAAALSTADALTLRLPPAQPASPAAVAAMPSATPRQTVSAEPTATPSPTVERPTADESGGDSPATEGPELETATPPPASTPVVVVQEACGNVPPAWRPYIVQRGDTLFRLSLASGATISEIVQANCLDISLLLSGTQVFLPAAPPARVQCGPPQSWASYLVRPGDTLFSLARTTGTTVYQIIQANCLGGARILSGRKLFLPSAPDASAPMLTPSPTEPQPTVIPQPTETPAPPTITPRPSPRPTDPPPPPTQTTAPSPTPSPIVPTPTETPPDPTPMPTEPPPEPSPEPTDPPP